MLLSVIDAEIVTRCGRMRCRAADLQNGVAAPRCPAACPHHRPRPSVPSGTSGNKRRKESGLSWVSEPELRLIDPYPVKDDPQLAGEGDLGPLGTSPLGHVHGPGLELRPSCNPRHDDVRGFE